MTFRKGMYVAVAFGALAIASIPASGPVSAAQSKLTYEQAWAKCKQWLDTQKIPGTMTSNERYLRGSACMKKLGYSI